MGYKKDVIKGLSWLSSFRIITRIISFLRTAILARILSPQDFGLFGIVTIVLSIAEIITETGINIFLVQKKDEIDSYINTAWVVSILRGIIIAFLILILAPLISSFFKEPEVLQLLQLISIVPFVRGFINPSIAKFIKELQFKKEFIYRTSIFTIESLVTLLFVFTFHTYYGLVIGLIFGAIFEVFLSFIMIKPYPQLKLERNKFIEVIHKGKWMTASGIFNYLYQSIDTLAVGRILGTTQLGFYDMTYKISSLPITEFSDVITRSTFPVLVKITDDKKRLLRAFLLTMGSTIVLVLPVCAVFFFFSEQVLGFVLGSQWVSAAPILRILTFYGAVKAISNVSNVLFYSVNRQDIVTRVTFISLLCMLITLIPFINKFSVEGAGYAAVVGAIASLPLTFYYLFKLLR